MHEQLPQPIVHRVSQDVSGNDRPINGISCDNPYLAIIRRVAAGRGQSVRDLLRVKPVDVPEYAVATGEGNGVRPHVRRPSVGTPISDWCVPREKCQRGRCLSAHGLE
jgi:hypothetical protein